MRHKHPSKFTTSIPRNQIIRRERLKDEPMARTKEDKMYSGGCNKDIPSTTEEIEQANLEELISISKSNYREKKMIRLGAHRKKNPLMMYR